jgi:hypothetical protein
MLTGYPLLVEADATAFFFLVLQLMSNIIFLDYISLFSHGPRKNSNHR